MPQAIIVDKDLSVKIFKLIQFPVPGIFDDCSTEDEKKSMARFFSGLIKEEYKLDTIYLIEPDEMANESKLIACLMTISSAKPFAQYTNYHYQLHVLWFQKDYAFPIEQDVLQKLASVPFREVATKEKNPF